VSDNGIDRKQITEELMKEFPTSAHKTREQQGKKLTYVDGTTVFRRLINATDNNFSIEVLEDSIQPFGQNRSGDRYLLRARVRLTIPGFGSREHVGVQIVNAESGGEDLWKGHVTDAIKKAATLFGVGLELYGPDHEYGDTKPKGPLTDAEFLTFVNNCGADADRWRQAIDLAGLEQHRWDLILSKAPSEAWKKRFAELRPQPVSA